MILAEVLDRKDGIKKKIKELRLYLSSLASNDEQGSSVFSKIDGTISEIYKLQDDYQKQIFLIDKINRSIPVEVGTSKLTLADVVKLRCTVQRKIEVLDELINSCLFNEKTSFDIVELMGNRDKLLEEYYILNNVIKSKDWTMELPDDLQR